jgi:RecB family exonuclease
VVGPAFSLIVTPYGRPATVALREQLTAAKGGDPLAPATVVVPSNFAALSARRLLASGEVGAVAGDTPGLANVRFVTIYALAQHLGASALAREGKVPLSTPVLVAAVRRVLTDEPGIFRPVADHPATEQALARAFAELSEVSGPTLDLLAQQSERAREVVRIYRATRERLAGRHDEYDLLAAATRSVREGAPLDDLGPVIVHLPQRLTPAAAELLVAVAERLPVPVIAGLTGRPRADEPVAASTQRLGLALDQRATPLAGSEPIDVMSASDPDEEVRAVVRLLARSIDEGEPLNRMAVVYPVRQPYLLALHEQLTAAGIPFNGPATRNLAATAAGRTLLGLVALLDHDLRRDDLIAWLDAAPVHRADGRFVPATRWDDLSREAGIVSGPADWDTHLAAVVRRSELAVEHLVEEDEPSWRIDAARRHAADAEELRSFVADLVGRLQGGPALDAPAPWSQWATWLGEMLRHYLGDVRLSTRWPKEEVDDYQRVEAALDRLRSLDDIDGDTDLHGFRRMLEAELDVPSARRGTFGEGVLLMSVQLATGLDLDQVFVVGLAEGTLPGHHRDDSLLPDAEREHSSGELTTRSDRSVDEHRFLLTALASARRRTVTFPRGDPRRGRTRLASRWLSDETGREALERSTDAIESFSQGLRRAPVAASVADFDLRALLLHADGGAVVAGTDLVAAVPELVAGFALIDGRASETFTRFDGNLTAIDGDVVDLSERIVSPTSLQNWATCPRQYLLSHVLRLGQVERPEAAFRVSHLDRGTLVHEILEVFVGEHLEADDLPALGEPWSPDARARAHAIATKVFADFEHTGITGKAVIWEHDKEGLHADIEGALDLDDSRRSSAGVTPIAVEMPFGLDGVAPVELGLPGGRTVSFRGRADRVDRGADGQLAVIDYKTGKAADQRELDADPVRAGMMLQLPIYGLAARQQYGEPDTPVAAHYWYVSSRGEFKTVGYDVDQSREDRFVEVVETISDGIEQGVFPAYPGSFNHWYGTNDNCGYCPFDRLCPSSRLDEWERIEGEEAIAPFLALDLVDEPEDER